jgi:hypothetical protein
MRARIAVLISVLLAAPAPVAAQLAATSKPPRLVISESATAGLPVQPKAAREQRDSLKNGTIIGAIVGAAVMGGFVTFLCNALQEPSDPSCLGASLTAIGIGAGAGAAGGLAIDALLDKQQRRVIRVRIPLRK